MFWRNHVDFWPVGPIQSLIRPSFANSPPLDRLPYNPLCYVAILRSGGPHFCHVPAAAPEDSGLRTFPLALSDLKKKNNKKPKSYRNTSASPSWQKALCQSGFKANVSHMCWARGFHFPPNFIVSTTSLSVTGSPPIYITRNNSSSSSWSGHVNAFKPAFAGWKASENDSRY